jgi:hypothetical protein
MRQASLPGSILPVSILKAMTGKGDTVTIQLERIQVTGSEVRQALSTPQPADEKIDTVIIGGGQAGLAMSYLLIQEGREHVVLEKGQRVGESWRRRWDSFTLVTPNWQLRLPGHEYEGRRAGWVSARDEVVSYLEAYAAPV